MHQHNYFPRPRQITATFFDQMCGVAQICTWSKSPRWPKDSWWKHQSHVAHFSLVANVHHLSTCYASPNSHLVFDDLLWPFETFLALTLVPYFMISSTFQIWLKFLLQSNVFYDNIVCHSPPLDKARLNAPNYCAHCHKLHVILLKIVKKSSGLINTQWS